MKSLAITFLLEEHKYVDTRTKEAAENQLKQLPLQRLFDMLLEKARNDGREQALNIYQSQVIPSYVDFSYQKIKKGK